MRDGRQGLGLSKVSCDYKNIEDKENYDILFIYNLDKWIRCVF